MRCNYAASEQLMLQRHIVLRLQTNTSTEDVDQRVTLLGKSVDHRSTRRRHGSLEHVAQHTQDAVEALPVFFAMPAPLNASHQLRNDHKVNDERRSQQRVLADVENGD